MRAIVVGAGIGGLSTAIALRRVGVEATVFERAGELKEIGAGVALAANAVRALRGLGLADAIKDIGVPVRDAEICSWQGEVLSRLPVLEIEQRVGAESMAVHRADLQAVLLKELGQEKVRLGAKCVGFEQGEEGVVAWFGDGREERGDLLIGADGLRSAIRTQLIGDGPPRYAGYTAWRAVVKPERELLPPGYARETWGRGARFISVQIGEGRVYWAATRNAPQGEEEAPVASRRKSAVSEIVRGWHEPIEELVSSTEETSILRTDIYDRKPVKRWSKGWVTLLGDAAHPMTPDLGQGACQAIEDAVALARCLSEEGSVASALQLYVAWRVPRTTALIRSSRRVGQVGQLQNPLACWLRNALVRMVPSRVQLRQLEQAVGYRT